jgi:photosystem II stability/assembly factor-like uncharacterized protein
MKKNYIKSLNIRIGKVIIFLGFSAVIILNTNQKIYSQNFWEPTGISSFGNITCLSFDSKEKIFLGAINGLYYSTNNGESWDLLGLAYKDISSIFLYRNAIIVGTYGNGIYHSSDNGQTWIQTESPGNNIICFAINKSGDIYAGTLNGLLRSTDNGVNWTVVSSNYSNIYCITITHNGYILIGTSNGISRSTNNGMNWISNNNGLSDFFIKTLAIDSNDIIYTGTRNGNIYRSTNSGESWVKVNEGLSTRQINAMTLNIDGDIFAGTSDAGVLRSNDKGIIWVGINSGLSNFNIKVLAINQSGYIFTTTADGKVYRSTKKVSDVKLPQPTLSSPANDSKNISIDLQFVWNPINGALSYTFQVSLDSNFTSFEINQDEITTSFFAINNLLYSTKYYWRVKALNFGGSGAWSETWNFTTKQSPPIFWQQIGGTARINTLAVNNRNFIFSGSNGYGIYRSTDNGGSWTQVEPTNSLVYTFAFNDKDVLFAGLGPGGVNYSYDDGLNWEQTTLTYEDIHALAFNSKGNLFAGGYKYIYKSTDNGVTWSQYYLNDGVISSIIISKTNDNIIASSRAGGVFLSINNGLTWSQIGLVDKEIRSLALNSRGEIFAATDGKGIYYTTDNGLTWKDRNNGLSDSSVITLAISENNFIYIATANEGTFRSMDNGQNWEQINTGLKDKIVTALTIDKNGYLLAGTWSGRIFRSIKTATTSIKPEIDKFPDEFLLEQNFPNPFNPVTTIRYSLPGTGHVRLSIYDMMGREIKELVNENQNAGRYEVMLNAGLFSSGVYYYRLQTDKYSSTKRLILLK